MIESSHIQGGRTRNRVPVDDLFDLHACELGHSATARLDGSSQPPNTLDELGSAHALG